MTETVSVASPMPSISDFNKSNGRFRLVVFRDRLLTEIEHKTTYAKMEDVYGVNRFYLWHIIHDPNYVPPVKVLKRLGIEITASVVVVMGDIPDGTQAIKADQCSCGQWFISNHPRRKKCFVCSPFRKKVYNNNR